MGFRNTEIGLPYYSTWMIYCVYSKAGDESVAPGLDGEGAAKQGKNTERAKNNPTPASADLGGRFLGSHKLSFGATCFELHAFGRCRFCWV